MSIVKIVPPDARMRLRRAVLDSRLGGPYMRLREPYQHVRYIDACDMVLDGFPRSANTYAWYASKLTLEPMRIVRGHTHSVETLRMGVSAGKPTMLLLRNPDDAVSSLVQMRPGLTFDTCFKSYAHFHELCVALGDGLFVADFESVTNDFGAVLASFYNYYGVDWPVYQKTEGNERRVFDVIDHANMKLNAGVIREAGVARPSGSRVSSAEILRGLSDRDEKARARASTAYRALLAK